jgi:protein-disulfide isomerase
MSEEDESIVQNQPTQVVSKRKSIIRGGPLTTILFLLAFFLVSYSLGVMTEKNTKLSLALNQNGMGSQAAQAGTPQAAKDPNDINTYIEKVGQVPPVTDQDHIRGNKNAKLTLIEYSDFECPFCKKFYPTTNQIVSEYKDNIRLVFRHFPLNFHANAQKQAEATECANELGGNDKFWEYHDKIFERTTSNGTGFALDKLVPLAKELSLDENKFKACLDSNKYAQHVKDDMAGGQKAGIQGTPGNILINAKGESKLISGALPFELFKQAIDQSL